MDERALQGRQTRDGEEEEPIVLGEGTGEKGKAGGKGGSEIAIDIARRRHKSDLVGVEYSKTPS